MRDNMLGKTLAQYCPTDSALQQEQKRIEGELKAFEEKIFGDKQRKDSLDSIANSSDKKVRKKNARRGDSGVEVEQTKVKSRRTSSSSSSGSGSQPRVSVRRQRH